MKAHKLIIKWKGSNQVINALKVSGLKEFLPTKDVLIGHITFQKLKVKNGLGVSPFEITVSEDLKETIRKDLAAKGYKGPKDQVPLFTDHNSLIPICVLFL